MPLAEARNIKIENDVGEIPSVSMDAERIMQVLRNLIGNALKFTPRGGSVRVAVRQTDDGVHVSVTDTGSGIPPEHSMIFEKFRQAPLRPPPVSGNGVGPGNRQKYCTGPWRKNMGRERSGKRQYLYFCVAGLIMVVLAAARRSERGWERRAAPICSVGSISSAG